MKTITRNQFLVFLAVVIIFAGLFFIYDLNISTALFNRTNAFGRILEVIGEWPNSFALIIGAGVIFGATITKERILSIQSLILFLVGGVGWGGLTLYSWKHYHIEDVDLSFKVLAICGAISVVGNILVLYLFTKVKKDTLKKYLDLAFTAVLTALLTLLVVNIIKVFWGRLRFREMTNPVEQFTRWLFPQGITGDKSFPSGHTANSTTIIVLLPLISKISDEKRWQKITLSILVILWPIATALSRVIVGAHFASDTLFGMAITVVIFYIVSNNILIKNKKRQNAG